MKDQKGESGREGFRGWSPVGGEAGSSASTPKTALLHEIRSSVRKKKTHTQKLARTAQSWEHHHLRPWRRHSRGELSPCHVRASLYASSQSRTACALPGSRWRSGPAAWLWGPRPGCRGPRPGCKSALGVDAEAPAWVQSTAAQSTTGLGAERHGRPSPQPQACTSIHACAGPQALLRRGLPGATGTLLHGMMWCHSWNRSLVLPWKIRFFFLTEVCPNLPEGQWKRSCGSGAFHQQYWELPLAGSIFKAWIQNTTLNVWSQPLEYMLSSTKSWELIGHETQPGEHPHPFELLGSFGIQRIISATGVERSL